MRYRDLRGVLSSTVAVMAVAVSTPAFAQVRHFNIPAQSAVTGLPALAKQADIQLLVSSDAVEGKTVRALKGRMTVDEAIRRLVSDADLQIVNSDGKTYTLAPKMRERSTLQAPTYQAAQNAPQYDEIIVTAQKKEERITDVPIAMTALSAQALDDYKIEGGSELLRAVPNVNFSKSNFSMYNFSIRGIGTKAISASSDPAVAVSFNNTPLVRNRLFEAEFFDMQRIEVLRGPQGTLYGRNATAGVVNLISALPTQEFAGSLKAETGNYKSRRLNGMLNLPIAETLGVRVAGSMTKRDGYDYNSFNDTRVNGRDLWSTRATVAWEPSENFKANFIWQHFAEDDDRARTGKQLCHTDPGPETFGGVELTDRFVRGKLSQGCLPGSLYDDGAYGAPNGSSLAYVFAPYQIFIGRTTTLPRVQEFLVKDIDPYAGIRQSKNLREVSTSYDPKFRANNDVFQLNLEANVSGKLKFSSNTSFSSDEYYSTQDYNRFASNVMFNDTLLPRARLVGSALIDTTLYPGAAPGGKFCDPQLGCSDRLLSADISSSSNKQWSQELRVQSNFDGKLNFNVGVNYLDFKSTDKYYVFNNFFTLIAQYLYGEPVPGVGIALPRNCPLGDESIECIYVDPNPMSSLNDKGHNYFLSNNGVSIRSKALFGELYYNPTDNLKVTFGLRYTDDKKVSTQIPSQLLLGGGTDTSTPGSNTGGRVNSGYPALPDIHQQWKKFTGRLVVDWKPELSFTDDTLLYASASRGYKGGGTNPPRVDINQNIVQYLPLEGAFRPEYVNAFEVGMKNTFLGGRASLNLTAFYYDYTDYQVSQIVDRISFNENFNATSWGLELEAAWRLSSQFRIDANAGFLQTRLGSGAQSIDVMNRTQGNPDWVVLRPWIQAPSNCVAPRALVEQILKGDVDFHGIALGAMCPGGNRVGDFNPATTGGISLHQNYQFTYDPFAPYDPTKVGVIFAYDGTDSWLNQTSGAPNSGRGFYADLTGHELPNSPNFTFNVGADYKIPLSGGRWNLIFHGDYYYQSSSYARIYNTDFDKIRGWDNINLSISLNNVDDGFGLQFYVKNLLNNDSITDAFTNADDTGLSTNVFVVDPRIVGLTASVKF